MFVGRIDEIAQPVVDELLRKRACLHVGIHVDFLNLKTLVFQHRLHRDNVRVHLAPRQRLDGRVDDVGTVVAHFENRGH